VRSYNIAVDLAKFVFEVAVSEKPVAWRNGIGSRERILAFHRRAPVRDSTSRGLWFSSLLGSETRAVPHPFPGHQHS